MSLDEKIVFEDIYIRYMPKIQHFAFSYLSDMESAKEVAQEVFLRLWYGRDKIDPDKNIMSYLLVITRNICLNILKKRILDKRYKDGYARLQISQINYCSLADSISGKLIEKEMRIMISNAVNSMPESVRSTFLLSRTTNLKQYEIAEIQGVTLRTVESRLSMALKILRLHLKDYLTCILILLFNLLDVT